MTEQLPSDASEKATGGLSFAAAIFSDDAALSDLPPETTVPDSDTPLSIADAPSPLYGPPSDDWPGGGQQFPDPAGIFDLLSDIYYNPQEHIALIVIVVKLILLIVGTIVFIGLMLRRRRSK
ncbi:MAG: transmembrane domain-containing protein [Coriobacteriales bacterium]|jgi:hypothetical protein|nr:transmembrane domain-containing protein [Coriobacteriales bacterium]